MRGLRMSHVYADAGAGALSQRTGRNTIPMKRQGADGHRFNRHWHRADTIQFLATYVVKM